MVAPHCCPVQHGAAILILVMYLCPKPGSQELDHLQLSTFCSTVKGIPATLQTKRYRCWACHTLTKVVNTKHTISSPSIKGACIKRNWPVHRDINRIIWWTPYSHCSLHPLCFYNHPTASSPSQHCHHVQPWAKQCGHAAHRKEKHLTVHQVTTTCAHQELVQLHIFIAMCTILRWPSYKQPMLQCIVNEIQLTCHN